MKVYLVIERNNSEREDDFIFGVFASEEKAEQIKNDMLSSFEEHGEDMNVGIVEMILDEVTEDYEFFMYN